MTAYAERLIARVHDLERDLRAAQAKFRQSVPSYLREAHLPSLLTAPLIYSLLLPLALLDVWVTLYQWVCFPIYGISGVPRGKYFVLDRHKLAYLNAIEKTNCTFCSYANGVIAYVREIGARTEQYWCPIKHSHHVHTHPRYERFFDYGDAASYRQHLPAIRKDLRDIRAAKRRVH